MLDGIHRTGTCPSALLHSALFGLLIAGAGWPDDKNPSAAILPGPNQSRSAESMIATSSGSKQLDLLLTRAELLSIVRRHEPNACVTFQCPVDEDEIIVTAPVWLAPMRDVAQDVGGGIVAPFWAIMHPKDAWRILVPIPPKGRPQKVEPPVPDPR